jgi:hypothetical protein
VEVLALVKRARERLGRVFGWDARLESSCIAVLFYLYRRAYGEQWAGRGGSGRFGCSVAQLVMGLAPIMGWGGLPNRGRLPRDKYLRERQAFVERHRASVRRWLDWLELAGLVSHTPQQDEDGVWWRTIIELHPAPEIEGELLQAAVDRRAGWPGRERRRRSRARRRDLTAILRRARLTRAERRARGVERRRRVAECAGRQRVAEAVAESLELAAKAHVSHPFGASTTSRDLPPSNSQDETSNRGLTGARTYFSETATELQTGGGEGEAGQAPVGEDLRWAVYNKVMAARFAHSDEEWAPVLDLPCRRVAELLEWPNKRPCPRWRLIEAWTHAAHGPYMAVSGGFRLAFWSEDRGHHGPRLERALARYARYATVRPSGWPESPVAAFAAFLAAHTPKQEGPQRGMAYDVQRFNELTKEMSAYAHVTGEGYLERAARRTERRRGLDELAQQVNRQLRFRIPVEGADARLRRASELLDSDYAPHQQAGRALYAHAKREQRLSERDKRLLAGAHPADADGRYRAAYAYALRWGLPAPPTRWGTKGAA